MKIKSVKISIHLEIDISQPLNFDKGSNRYREVFISILFPVQFEFTFTYRTHDECFAEADLKNLENLWRLLVAELY